MSKNNKTYTQTTNTLISFYKIAVCFLFMGLSNTGFAQNGINSPSSRYGFGTLSDREQGFNKAMGGVAQGFRGGQIVNIANPASLSAVDSLTALFDLGFSVHTANYKMNGLSKNIRNTSFDYFAFHFRAYKGLGIALSLMPYSNISYDVASQSSPVSGGSSNLSSYNSSSTYNGTGGLRQFALGVGWQIVKPLSIGVNVGLLWGDYTHNKIDSYSASNASTNKRIYYSEITTYTIDAGLQYVQPINTTDNITFGATYGFGHKINSAAIRTTQNVNASGTLESSVRIPNAFSTPHSITAGLAYSKSNKLSVGADFSYQMWSKAKFPNHDFDYTSNDDINDFQSSKGNLYDKMRVSLGVSWTPDVFSHHYYNKISWKIGGYYSNSYTKTDPSYNFSQKPNEFGITAGCTLPLTNRNLFYSTPKINLSIAWIHANIPYYSLSKAAEQTLSENYFKFSVGITISERWFYKWKVN